VYLALGAAVFFPNKEARRRHLFQLISDMNVRMSNVINLCTASLILFVTDAVELLCNGLRKGDEHHPKSMAAINFSNLSV